MQKKRRDDLKKCTELSPSPPGLNFVFASFWRETTFFVELKFLLIQDGSALAHTSISFVKVSFERAS